MGFLKEFLFATAISATSLVSAPALAGSVETATLADSPNVVDLDVVAVSGVRSAPRLWELSRDGKTLLIMGTLEPAPKQMIWNSSDVESRIAEAGLILAPPGVVVGTDVGLFRGALLLPAYRRSRKNPDSKRLVDILPRDMFERWRSLKKIYIGGGRRGVERLRPVHAAKELFDAAVERGGMTRENLVKPVVERTAQDRGIPIKSTAVNLMVKNPKALLKQLNAAHLDDLDCLTQTMDRLDEGLKPMIIRANAWAMGDIGQLRGMPSADQKEACIGALADNAVTREQGLVELSEKVRENWLAAVREAFNHHDTVFATMPIAQLLEPAGVIAALRDEGFHVQTPD